MGTQVTEAATEEIAHPFMVLLVDDQPLVASLLQRELAHEKDISIHYCQDSSEAVATAEKVGPTVILLDLNMPGIDGLTVCRFIRAHPATRDIPVIMLSSNDDPATKAAAFTAGANDYIVKLPDAIELVARLRYHSAAYVNKLQRDEAYRALRASQMKLAELNMQLLKLANVDGLTGTVNRRHFEERLAEEWLRAWRNRYPLTLIMFDVDGFKPYNDRFGHLEGDACLKRIALCAQEITSRPADTVARYDGEGFILLLPQTDSSGALKVAEKLRADIENLHLPNPDSAISPYVTISAGVITVVPEADSTQDNCIRLVSEALARAKEAGRNRLSVALPPAG